MKKRFYILFAGLALCMVGGHFHSVSLDTDEPVPMPTGGGDGGTTTGGLENGTELSGTSLESVAPLQSPEEAE